MKQNDDYNNEDEEVKSSTGISWVSKK